MNPKKKTDPAKKEDISQQKISAFFQQQTGPPQSKLFSSIAKTKPTLPHKFTKCATKTRIDALTIHRSENRVNDVCERTLDGKSFIAQTSTSKNKRNLDSAVPRMKVASSVLHRTLDICENLDAASSPETVIIPDTPDKTLDRPKHKVRAVCRSFLRPASLLTTMPMRPSPIKTKPRRSLKMPSISIEFCKDAGSGIKEERKMDASERKVVLLEQEKQSFDSNSDSGISSGDSQSLQTIEELAEKPEVSTQAPTPTKITSDGRNLKRMAKSGTSPVPKRTTDSVTAEPSGRASEAIIISQTNAANTKRLLLFNKDFSDVNTIVRSVNSYQVSGSVKHKQEERQVTCSGDKLLGEILNEIGHPQLSEGSYEKPQKFRAVKAADLRDVSSSFVQKSTTTEINQNMSKSKCHSSACLDLDMINSSNSSDEMTEVELKLFGTKGRYSVDAMKPTSVFSSGAKAEFFIKPTDISEQEIVVEDCELSHFDLMPSKTTEHFSGNDRKETFLLNGNIENNHLQLSRSLLDEAQNHRKSFREPHLNVPHSWPLSQENLRHSDMDSDDEVDVNSDGITSPLGNALVESFCHLTPFKTSSKFSGERFTDMWNRFTIQNVHCDHLSSELVLDLIKDGKVEDRTRCILQGVWADTHVEVGDIVHITLDASCPTSIGDSVCGNQRQIIINDHQGQIVINPDLLLSGTSIVSGVHCLRRSVLNEKFKGIDCKNSHMLYGSIIHRMFQEVLKEQLTKKEEILSTAVGVVQSSKFVHEMYGQGITAQEVMGEVQSYIEPLQIWQHKYMHFSNDVKRRGVSSDVFISKIHDIEETIWSPRFGIKGKIDLTVEAKLVKEGGQLIEKVLPLELKTGKATFSVEHKGQVTLYAMMTSDRHKDPSEGLLLYLKQPDMRSIPVKCENKRDLLQLRNEMAYYLSHQAVKMKQEGDHVTYYLGRLPAPINNLNSCSKCPQLLNCAIYQKNVEYLHSEKGHSMSQLVPDTLSHLSQEHLDYFTHWLLCIDLESASDRSEGLSNIWCMPSDERESYGDCLQQMVILETVLGVPETQAYTEGKGCCVQFQRKPGFHGCKLNEVGVSKNDSVVISSEDGRFIGLSTGFIKDLTDTIVEVVVDRDSFHENEVFKSIVFRIDRCDAFKTSGYLLTNLTRLMDATSHSHKLRSFIINMKKPEFHLKMSKSTIQKIKSLFKPLNAPQKTAVLKVLMCKDYVLIKGYPGTGKTSTIVALVKILKELGHSVLLTGYTHSSVDNILIKLKSDGVPFLRLGRSGRIHPAIQDHAAENLTSGITTVEKLQDFYNSYAIVATSCLGTNHPIFSQRKFDVCIVDEASQVLQPACLGPIFCADRFVLVGDLKQLPPVVQSKEASLLGMEESLFARLDRTGATYDLNMQYRMNSTIVQLPNELVYDGALVCGTELVANACIMSTALCVNKGSEWISRALDPSLAHAVLFLDTSQISAHDSSDGRGVKNEKEVEIILHLCHAFVQAGIVPEEMGVIAPYRLQVKCLKQSLKCFPQLLPLEVNTVDQYQGRDKSVILISFVRSSSSLDSSCLQKGGLLNDMRRLNVAVTRAKHKLVLVGDANTLQLYQPVHALLNTLRSHQHILTLPSPFELPQLCIGVAGELKDKALKLLSPENNITQEITISGDTIKINTTTPLSSVEVNATTGQEVDSRSLDGRAVKTVYTLDGETLVETITGDYSTISRRFIEGGQLIMKLSASGVDAIRHYDKV